VDVGGERSASAVVWVNAALHVGAVIYQGEQCVLDCVDHVREVAGRYQVVEVIADPWRFGQAAQELEREGLTVAVFPQHDRAHDPGLGTPARRDRRAAHHFATRPAARPSRSGRHRPPSRRGWRIDKPNPRTNIDAVIVLCMAVERAEVKPEPVELLGWL
jgi:hypothetical protein